MNYVVSAIFVNCVYNYSKDKSYNYIKNKTVNYSWYIIKFPFVYVYKKYKYGSEPEPEPEIGEDYDIVDD